MATGSLLYRNTFFPKFPYGDPIEIRQGEMRFQTKAVLPAYREMVVGDRFKFTTPAGPPQHFANPGAIVGMNPDVPVAERPQSGNRIDSKGDIHPLDRRKYGFGFLRASQSTAEGRLLAERVSGLLTELPAELSPPRSRQFPA